MEKEKIVEIAENAKDKPNKYLFETRELLYNEFNHTKELIIELTLHMETIEEYYNKINAEIKNREK